MPLGCEIGQKTKDLSLPATPVTFRIYMQNLQKLAGITGAARRQVFP